MSDSSGEEEEEEYPPWLEDVLDDEAGNWDEVVVLEAADDAGTDPEWMEVGCILAPDAMDAASGQGAGQCRTYRVRRYSTILIAAGPTDAPYIGLVDKVFRKRDAKSIRNDSSGRAVYRLHDFGVHAYWFYRPSEVPDAAWKAGKRLSRHAGGRALYKLPEKGKLQQETHSERQVLFSSHHTLHDYPDDKGILAMDGFLQACKVHWLGVEPEVPRYEVHGSTLLALQEPGFVVRGFLWCNKKHEPQRDAHDKQVWPLADRWADKDTRAIVTHCRKEYQARSQALLQRNKAVLQRFHAAKAAKLQSIPSDEDEPEDSPGTSTAATAAGGGGRGAGRPSPSKGSAGRAAGAGRGSATKVASPRLEGVDADMDVVEPQVGAGLDDLGLLEDDD